MSDTLVSLSPPERQDAVRLADGRALAWYEWGPADGLPVLFCTGAGMSGWLGFGAGDLGDLGMRLLAIDRPGLGRSEPHPAKTLATWADDVRELIRARRLGTPLAVGFSQGAPFALTLAGRGLVRAAAIVSGQDDLAHPALRPLLTPEVAGMMDAVAADADGFERHVAGTASKEWLWGMVLAMSGERDRGVYGGADFARAYERALEEGFARGAAPYARDLVNVLGPWPVAPEAVAVPVELWYGGQDTSPVHSPDFGATLASRLRNARHVVDPAEGGSLLWTRSRDILARLREHADGA